MKTRPFLLPFFVLLTVFWSVGCGGGPGEPRVVFHPAGGADATLQVETARTSSERARGLMYRTQLDPDRGMIFIYAEPAAEIFWMKNTPLPLSIAFIDSDGRVIDIQDMQPYSEQLHVPAGPYIYAVEANQGWFAVHGIAVGDTAEFIED